MEQRYFSNNATTTVVVDSNTTIQVTSASSFPTSYPFYITLENVSLQREIIKVNSLASANVWNVTRAQESTTLRTFSAGDKVELRMTAGTIQALVNGVNDSVSLSSTGSQNILSNITINQSLTVNGNVTIGDAISDVLTVRPNSITWATTTSHTGSHTFSENVTVSGTTNLNGNVTVGNAAIDTVTIYPSSVTWANNPTHSGNHTFSGNLTVTNIATFNGNVVIGNATGDTLTVAGSSITWANNPTHSGNHTFSGNVTVSGVSTLNGNVSLGDSSADTLTIAPNAVAWTNNPTHSGNHTFSGTITADQSIRQKKVAIAASNIDVSLGDVFTKTISANTTFTVSNVPSSGIVSCFILELVKSAAFTINWWGVKWPGGLPPTLTTSGRDVLGFFTHDGGVTWTGVMIARDAK